MVYNRLGHFQCAICRNQILDSHITQQHERQCLALVRHRYVGLHVHHRQSPLVRGRVEHRRLQRLQLIYADTVARLAELVCQRYIAKGRTDDIRPIAGAIRPQRRAVLPDCLEVLIDQWNTGLRILRQDDLRPQHEHTQHKQKNKQLP